MQFEKVLKKMQENNYKNRIADKILAEQLEASGVVLIQGPKWCGKTTTAVQQAKSVVYMDDPRSVKSNLYFADTNPNVILDGDTPRLIDEWQLAPKLWDAARFEVSRRGLPGQLIFTGSAVPPNMSEIYHSGAGRFARVVMRPMTLWESGDSNGGVSLKSLFNGEDLAVLSPDHPLDEIAYLTCRGGWPGTLLLSRKAALRQAANYVDIIVNYDVSRADGSNKDAEFASRLLRAYARHQGGQVPISTFYTDLETNKLASMSEDTIASYINAFKKIFTIEDMPAWNPNLRSKTAIRTSDTRYFVDPSIAAAALGLGPNDLLNDLETMGLLFETLAVRDLRVYAEAMDGKVYHYRDKNGLECDAVIHLRNGKYGLVEIKLGGDTHIEEGAANLKKLRGKIDTEKMQEPSFMAVVTAVGKYAFRRADGVYVVPIGSLKD